MGRPGDRRASRHPRLDLIGPSAPVCELRNLGLNHPALRRAQALAVNEPIGVDITRHILQRKLEGQAANTQALGSADTYMFCDTDSIAIVATQTGDTIPCRGGPHVHGGQSAVKALSWDQVDEIRIDARDLAVPIHVPPGTRMSSALQTTSSIAFVAYRIEERS